MDPTEHGIVARYRDGEHAGRAIERLSLRGVEASRVRIVRELDLPIDLHTQRATDAGTAGRIGQRFLRGALYGTPAGALFGLVAMAIATDGATALAIGTAAGAMAGAGLGALAGLESTPTMSSAWEESFRPSGPDGVVLAVACADATQLDHVERTLAATGAIEIRRSEDLAAVLAAAADGEPAATPDGESTPRS